MIYLHWYCSLKQLPKLPGLLREQLIRSSHKSESSCSLQKVIACSMSPIWWVIKFSASFVFPILPANEPNYSVWILNWNFSQNTFVWGKFQAWVNYKFTPFFIPEKPTKVKWKNTNEYVEQILNDLHSDLESKINTNTFKSGLAEFLLEEMC